jgi:NRAMP (natural resistance-associated macrophage protein)-like metal ion transporter
MQQAAHKKLAALKQLGPGLITGAADDDPSGIATYSQAGSQFGFDLLWTVVLTYPLMVGIQVVSARIGRVTGLGLTANMRKIFPPWLCLGIVLLLVIANTINIAADIAAMGAALKLVTGGPAHVYSLAFGLISLILQVFIPYQRYVRVLKWLTLSLLAYVAVVFMVHIHWSQVLQHTLLPHISFSADYATVVVAVFGTTISPYLFFWQASQEVEEMRAHHHAKPLTESTSTKSAATTLRRIKVDTYIGMAFSNLVAFFIMLSTAVTLHAAGITTIATAAQAAEALRPIAGEATFLLFSLGIIGTGLLAVPVLAGSAAYAVAEYFAWAQGLDRQALEARGFYVIISITTLMGVLLDFTSIDPVKALFWSAVINGVIAIPIMAIMMMMAVRPDIMGAFTIKRRLQVLGWVATALMLVTVVVMLAYW